MKIKKGDKVVVISGKDKGKTGVILRAMPKETRVVIEGINIVKKHRRAAGRARKGQVVEKSMPIHASNVMLVDAKTGKGTRGGSTKKEGASGRVAKESGTAVA